MSRDPDCFEKLDLAVESMLRTARIPGAAIAIVIGADVVHVAAYGVRDLSSLAPMTSRTLYPIASTTKAINATLLGMLVDDGKLAWDAPVQEYLPRFRLQDSVASIQVTVRDLVTMRTGLPRHDWLWIENTIGRAELVERLRHLQISAGFRERFQYNNLTVTLAGHVAEVVTGESWEGLVRARIFEPLAMGSTGVLSSTADVCRSYHENWRRQLVPSRRLACEFTAPSGGAIYSTVEDMARWLIFNLALGRVGGQQLIEPSTLREIQSPQIPAGSDPAAPTPDAAYAMGWFVDKSGGHTRLTHGGNLHDVNSEVTLFRQERIGLVSFINFGAPSLAESINQHAFDLIMGRESTHPVERALARYEEKVADAFAREAAVRRIGGTSPSHDLQRYVGAYLHPGYGELRILERSGALALQRYAIELPLEHWHYDAWVVAQNELFPIHRQNALDRTNRLVFETGPDGDITALLTQIEPAVAPIRFLRQESLLK